MPREIVCRFRGSIFKVRSNSLLAEPLYVGHGFEDGEIEMLSRLAKPGMRVFDVGANVGLYSVLMGKAVAPGGVVTSFEPFPPMAKLLRENIDLNLLGNVRVCESAVSDRAGRQSLHIFPDGSDVYNSLGARSRVEKIESVQAQEVETTTLDLYASNENITSIDILKIDIEGNEERALIGSESLIRRSPKICIIVELYEPSAVQCGCSVSRLVEKLRSWGFGMHSIAKSGELVPVDPNDFRGTNAVFRRPACVYDA